MSATWQVGPSYTPFIHTTNSQYGAWSGGTGFQPTNGVPRKVIGGAALVPSPPAARISEVTAKDVAKIVTSTDPESGATREKFSDFMSRYGSGRITPLTSQYDRALAMHDAIMPKRRLSQTPGNSPEPDTLSETGTSSTSPRKSLGGDAFATLRGATRAQHATRDQFGALTSRTKDGVTSGLTDVGYRRSTTIISEPRTKYSEQYPTATYGQKIGDTNNNHVLQISGYRSEQLRPGLSRSNTFSGVPNYNESSLPPGGTGSRYGESRVGLEKLFDENRRDLANCTDPKYALTSPEANVGLHGVSLSTADDFRSQAVGASRDQARDYLRSRDLARDSGGESRDVAGRSAIYWLYGNQASRPGVDSGSAQQSRSLTPYRPADYMVKSEPEYGSLRHRNAPLLDVARKDMTFTARDDLILQHGSYMDRGGYGSPRSGTPYAARADVPDSGATVPAYGYDESGDLMKAPELISRPPISVQKSILKRGGSQPETGNVFANATYGETANYRGVRLGLHPVKQLPPLLSSLGSTKRGSSGKKVTFNLAMNRCKAFVE
ncbi:hypothetical protein LSH36_406g01012 [Paralvinella palmiformis]|uniref:Uncharacterized protein n=1 Tax=Paralvinella palmiformis TaxID=53620 RepID=A0AAD9JC04_9ANNE|nr:hypothetical protein LSH36_406g01012 [Paralvinella palmiformis]